MRWNEHSDLKEKHAFLSASKGSWLEKDDQSLIRSYESERAKVIGTRLHAYACESILLKQNLIICDKTLNMYVNDCIAYHMNPEQVLYYSEKCFGTADAIKFEDGVLHIYDLKTGKTKAPFRQLEIYAALFCYEYGIDPTSIRYELRIYQNNAFKFYEPEPNRIAYVLDRITHCDKTLDPYWEG